MQDQGKEEVRDAVLIALLTALGTSLINIGVEAAQKRYAEYSEKRRKRRKKGKRNEDHTTRSGPSTKGTRPL